VCFYYHITYLFITAKIDRLTKITLSPPTFSGEPEKYCIQKPQDRKND